MTLASRAAITITCSRFGGVFVLQRIEHALLNIDSAN
jgi:hypothetical protein